MDGFIVEIKRVKVIFVLKHRTLPYKKTKTKMFQNRFRFEAGTKAKTMLAVS